MESAVEQLVFDLQLPQGATADVREGSEFLRVVRAVNQHVTRAIGKNDPCQPDGLLPIREQPYDFFSMSGRSQRGAPGPDGVQAVRTRIGRHDAYSARPPVTLSSCL
jgi:hypothetical protein